MNLRHGARIVRLAVLLLLLLVLAVGLPASVPVAQAQTYSFSVPSLQMQVFVREDSSVRIVYDITFRNSGAPIDVVDIGTPHDDYDIETFSASVGDVPLNDIRTSTYIDTGVEIHLGSQQIASGEEGTLHVEFLMPDMLYGDTTRDDYASLQITPTWFDSDLVNGTTSLDIAVHMLPGVAAEEVLFQDVPFTDKALFDDHIVAVWQVPDWRATGPYRVGVSFPERGISGVIELNAFQLLVKYLEDNPHVTLGLSGVFVVLMGILFFRFSGNTGCSVFVILLVALGACVMFNPGMLLLLFPALVPLFFFNERHLRKRKRSYLPAIAQVEGGGIKRGLIAPEAAVILEQPLNKVLTLVIFGLLKKGVLRQTQESPLTVELDEAFRSGEWNSEEARTHRKQVAQQHNVVLHTYEHAFLDAIENNPGKPASKIDFSGPMKQLIEHAAGRVKNFDLSDTQDYYRRIIERALKEASTLEDIEQREQSIDRNLEWILMNEGKDYDPVFRSRRMRYGRSFYYTPIWIRSSRSGGSVGGFGGGEGPASPGGSTTFGDVAASFAGWTENTMGGMADAIMPGSVTFDTPSGVVDLSGADRATGSFFEELAKSSASGGGGGGGGCACAGCACACACAGGGR